MDSGPDGTLSDERQVVLENNKGYDPRTRGEAAYERVRRDLLMGRLLPGQRLVEAELVDSLGVSRAIVRSTLERLEHEGLVEKERNRGARVRMVTEQEAVELTQVRSVVEGLAAREAAIKGDASDFRQLRSSVEGMASSLANNDLLAYSECNIRLHETVMVASKHTTAQQLITRLRAQVIRFQFRTILLPGRTEVSFNEHKEVVEAIVARKAHEAELLMRRHLDRIAEDLGDRKGMGQSGVVAGIDG